MQRPRAAVAVAVAVLAVAAVVAAAMTRPVDPARPGDVLHRERIELDGAAALRIRYGSVDVRGEPSEVGALVAVPDGDPPAGGWPVVAYAHGTTGTADDCAPSARPELAAVGATVARLADAGFVAVATDYEGLGTAGPHPYLHGRSEARAVADSVRAARAAVDGAGAPWAVVGHSQGGHAALWVAEVGPELVDGLVGAVAMAPVMEPAALAAFPSLGALALRGWLDTDPDADEGVLTDVGRDAVDAAAEECLVEPAPGPLLDGAAPGFDRYLADGEVGRAPAAVPVLVAQGGGDQLTTPALTAEGVARLCALGSTVEVRVYDDADHASVVDAAAADVHDWLAARFAGEPAASSC